MMAEMAALPDNLLLRALNKKLCANMSYAEFHAENPDSPRRPPRVDAPRLAHNTF